MPDGLDMSHEDIQRTLQANLPLKPHNGHPPPHPPHQPHPAHPAHPHPHPVDLNPMDFIEHDVVAPPPHPPHPHPPSAQSTTEHSRNFDMGLDAFDVFGDFSDLQENHYNQQQPHLNKMKRGDAEHHLAQITEYSPDWAWSDVSVHGSCLRLVKSLDQGSVEKKDSTTSISICFSTTSFAVSYIIHTNFIHTPDRFSKSAPISLSQFSRITLRTVTVSRIL